MEAGIRTIGQQALLSSFQTIVVFITTKSIPDNVRSLTVKRQGRDQDIAKVYKMIDNVIDGMKPTRKNIGTIFKLW